MACPEKAHQPAQARTAHGMEPPANAGAQESRSFDQLIVI